MFFIKFCKPDLQPDDGCKIFKTSFIKIGHNVQDLFIFNYVIFYKFIFIFFKLIQQHDRLIYVLFLLDFFYMLRLTSASSLSLPSIDVSFSLASSLIFLKSHAS